MAKKKKQKTDAAAVASLVSAVRDSAAVDDALTTGAAWLKGEGELAAMETGVGLAAVAAASELGLAERISSAGTATDKAVRKAARSAAHRLRSAGVEVPEQATGTSWSIGREERVELPPQALIGLPEEDGYVPFLLATYGEENACLAGGAAGPVKGYRDEDHGHTGRSQTRRIVDDARRDHRLHEVPFHTAVCLLERAFDAAGGKRPGGWAHLLSHVDEGTLNSARLLDPMRVLPLELDVDALHRPLSLMEGRWAVPFQGDPEAMSGSLEAAMAALTSDAHPDDESRRAAIDAVIDGAATQALEGPQRASWVFGLNVSALLAHNGGDSETAAVARATALALEQGRAGQDVPWAREWVSRQLSWVTDMAMRMGQGEPAAE